MRSGCEKKLKREEGLGGRKTLEGESPLLKEGLSPSKPPSLPRTFPKSTRPYMAKICFAMFGRVLLGKVFLFLGRYFFAECGFAPVLFWRCIKDIPYVDSALAKRFQKTERHMGRSLQTLFSILPQSRIPFRTLQKIRTSRPNQNFPTRPPPSKRRNKSSLESWWGSCGEVRGG